MRQEKQGPESISLLSKMDLAANVKSEVWDKIAQRIDDFEREFDSTKPSQKKIRSGFQMFKTTAAAIAMFAIVGGGIGYSIHHTAPTPGQNTPDTTTSHGETPKPALGHTHHKSTRASRSRNEVVVPNVIGTPMREAESILASVGLEWVLIGTKQQSSSVASRIPGGIVVSQGVAAGSVVPRGTKIPVRFVSSK